MDTSKSILIVWTIIIVCIFISFKWRLTKSELAFAFRKVLSLIIYVGFFVFIVLICSFLIGEEKGEKNVNGVNLVMGIIILGYASFGIVNFTKSIFNIKDRELKGPSSVLMGISIIVGLFFAFVEIYYGMFILNDKWFVVDSEILSSTGKTAFEFVYYTFSVIITYSGSGIEISGVVPKIFQMGQMIYFYSFGADAIYQLLHNKTKGESIQTSNNHQSEP